MIKNYFKTTFRTLFKNKTYTFLNIVGLGLGLTGSILIFLFVRFHLNTDTFHRQADRIYRLVLDIHVDDGSIEHKPGTSVAMINTLKEDYPQVEKTAMCMFFYAPPTLAVQTNPSQWERHVESQGVAYGNTDLLHMFDFEWIAGNKQTALDGPNQVVLSKRQAYKYFGSTDVLGKILRINHQTDLVVSGIIGTPPINTDLAVDVLISLPTLKVLNPNYQLDNFSWHGHNNWLFVQLQEGAEARQLDQQLPEFVQKYLGEDFSHWHLHLQPLNEMHFDERYGGVIRKPLLLTLGLTGIFLILVACINFINLATAQAFRRAKEVGVRKVMGSSRKQLFWQFITETSCITLLSAALASLAIFLILPSLNTWLQLPLSLSLLSDPSVLIFLAAIILAVIMLAGSYPAVILSGLSPILALKSKITSTGTKGLSIRKVLVVLQFTISQVFTICALIVLYQMDYFLNANMGFEKETIVTVSLPESIKNRLVPFRNELLQYPDIMHVSLHHRPPVANINDGGYIKFDQRENWESFLMRDRWADSHYLEAYDLELIAGRNIQERDSVTEFLVNEEFVKRLNFNDPQEVLDKKIYDGNANVEGSIVGVVKNFHHRSLQHPIEPLAIYPYPSLFRQAGIRLNTQNISQTLQNIQTIWTKTFPDHVFEYEFVDETIAKMYQREETISHLSKVFTLATIIICFLGLYGLVLFITAQRIREIGIRKVLGATVPGILLLLFKDYIKLILVAFAIAIPLSNYFATTWLNHFAYHVTLSWWIFALPGLLFLLITLLSAAQQSLKAAYTNPKDTLRYE